MIRSARFRDQGTRRGAATVEFAILLPLLVFLFMISVDFARLFYHYVTVSNAARNAALWLSDPLAKTESQWTGVDGYKAAALADATNLPLQASDVTKTDGMAGTTPTHTVTVTYAFKPFITKFPWSPLPDTINLTRTIQVRELSRIPAG